METHSACIPVFYSHLNVSIAPWNETIFLEFCKKYLVIFISLNLLKVKTGNRRSKLQKYLHFRTYFIFNTRKNTPSIFYSK